MIGEDEVAMLKASEARGLWSRLAPDLKAPPPQNTLLQEPGKIYLVLEFCGGEASPRPLRHARVGCSARA